MNENNANSQPEKESSLNSDSNEITNNKKPWYKNKNMIISVSSILGIGAVATAIAVPVALFAKQDNSNFDIKNTINILNLSDNEVNRVSVWNSYMEYLANTLSFDNTTSLLDTIFREEAFIDEFIIFLVDNLYTTIDGTETGAITQVNKDLIKATLIENKLAFNDKALAIYHSLFSFHETTSQKSMFDLKDKIASPSIDLSLHMPLNLTSFDIIYNEDLTVDFKIIKHSSIASDNARLSITKFSSPSINAATSYYFKPGIIKIPQKILSNFSTFFNETIAKEKLSRAQIELAISSISNEINKDTSLTKGLSYWNSFAMNYATSNLNFLKMDLLNNTLESNLLNFIKQNANGVTNIELNEIKTISSTESEFGLNLSPFVATPNHSNLLFNTTNAQGSQYYLKLNITNFNFTYAVNNLFSPTQPIVVKPNLKLDGFLSKSTNGMLINYPIKQGIYNFSDLINMKDDSEILTGGFVGFFVNLFKSKPNDITTLTNGLVALNSKSTNDQISFWNNFNSNPISKVAINNALKSPNVLYDFISQSVDFSNPTGIGAFPLGTLEGNETFKNSINAILADPNLISSDLSVVNSTAATHPAISLADIKWGSGQNDKFSNIYIYFGSEENSIEKINVVSTTTGDSNIFFSQSVADTNKTFNTSEEVKNEAKKRISIVFETSNTVSHVFYLKQYKSQDTPSLQVAFPIMIPSTFLTTQSKFIEAIGRVS